MAPSYVTVEEAIGLPGLRVLSRGACWCRTC